MDQTEDRYRESDQHRDVNQVRTEALSRRGQVRSVLDHGGGGILEAAGAMRVLPEVRSRLSAARAISGEEVVIHAL